MDDRLRREERAYAQDPNPTSLERYNSILELAGQDAFLPIGHLQILFEDISNIINSRVDASGREGSSDFRVIQGWYTYSFTYPTPLPPAKITTRAYFRVTAHNVFGDDHTNAHLTIKKEGIYRNQSEGHELDVFSDDMLYGSWRCDPSRSTSSRNRELHKLHQFQMSLNQPWIYSARRLLDFMLKHLDELSDDI